MKPKTAEHFITIGTHKQILLWCDAYPAHELVKNQVAVTLDEFKFIEACRGDLEKAKRIIKSIEIKIKIKKGR